MTSEKHFRPRWLPLAAAILAAAGIGRGAGLEPPRGAVHHHRTQGGRHRLLHVQQLRAGRDGYVTLIANYQPLQDPYGGPNYFTMDPNALYEIHVDNNGDAKEDITFQFRFQNKLNGDRAADRRQERGDPADAGRAGDRRRDSRRAATSTRPTRVDVVRGDRRSGARASRHQRRRRQRRPSTSRSTTSARRRSPTTPAYAAKHIYSVNIPGCSMPAKMFVGQRKEAFAVNLGTIFDLVNAPVAVITDPALINAGAEHHRRHERHHARARGAQELPRRRAASR